MEREYRREEYSRPTTEAKLPVRAAVRERTPEPEPTSTKVEGRGEGRRDRRVVNVESGVSPY